MSAFTTALRLSRRPCRRLGLGGLWQRAAHHDVWSSPRLSTIDRSGKTVFQCTGLARSGTTVLGSLIDQQPDALCLSEPFRSWFLYGNAPYEGGNWTRHPSRLVEELCRRRSERCIGIKETFYSREHPGGHANEHFFRDNAEHGIVTIGIVRDPRDVYASVEAMVGSRDEVPERFTRTWLAFVEWTAATANCVVTYEGLAASPGSELVRVCEALGIPCESSELELAARPGGGDRRALQGGAISTGSIGRFADRLGAAKAQQIEDRCGAAMASFGYL